MDDREGGVYTRIKMSTVTTTARPMYLVRFADGSFLGTFTARTSTPNNAAVIARDAVKAAALAKAHGGEAITFADAGGQL